MITDKLLLDNGYKEYHDSFGIADCLFQKKFENEKGIMYFIEFYKYEEDDDWIRYEVKLTTTKNKYALEILMYCIDKEMTIEQIEREVLVMWYGLRCNYYEEF